MLSVKTAEDLGTWNRFRFRQARRTWSETLHRSDLSAKGEVLPDASNDYGLSTTFQTYYPAGVPGGQGEEGKAWQQKVLKQQQQARLAMKRGAYGLGPASYSIQTLTGEAIVSPKKKRPSSAAVGPRRGVGGGHNTMRPLSASTFPSTSSMHREEKAGEMESNAAVASNIGDENISYRSNIYQRPFSAHPQSIHHHHQQQLQKEQLQKQQQLQGMKHTRPSSSSVYATSSLRLSRAKQLALNVQAFPGSIAQQKCYQERLLREQQQEAELAKLKREEEAAYRGKKREEQRLQEAREREKEKMEEEVVVIPRIPGAHPPLLIKEKGNIPVRITNEPAFYRTRHLLEAAGDLQIGSAVFHEEDEGEKEREEEGRQQGPLSPAAAAQLEKRNKASRQRLGEEFEKLLGEMKSSANKQVLDVKTLLKTAYPGVDLDLITPSASQGEDTTRSPTTLGSVPAFGSSSLYSVSFSTSSPSRSAVTAAQQNNEFRPSTAVASTQANSLKTDANRRMLMHFAPKPDLAVFHQPCPMCKNSLKPKCPFHTTQQEQGSTSLSQGEEAKKEKEKGQEGEEGGGGEIVNLGEIASWREELWYSRSVTQVLEQWHDLSANTQLSKSRPLPLEEETAEGKTEEKVEEVAEKVAEGNAEAGAMVPYEPSSSSALVLFALGEKGEDSVKYGHVGPPIVFAPSSSSSSLQIQQQPSRAFPLFPQGPFEPLSTQLKRSEPQYARSRSGHGMVEVNRPTSKLLPPCPPQYEQAFQAVALAAAIEAKEAEEKALRAQRHWDQNYNNKAQRDKMPKGVVEKKEKDAVVCDLSDGSNRATVINASATTTSTSAKEDRGSREHRVGMTQMTTLSSILQPSSSIPCPSAFDSSSSSSLSSSSSSPSTSTAIATATITEKVNKTLAAYKQAALQRSQYAIGGVEPIPNMDVCLNENAFGGPINVDPTSALNLAGLRRFVGKGKGGAGGMMNSGAGSTSHDLNEGLLYGPGLDLKDILQRRPPSPSDFPVSIGSDRQQNNKNKDTTTKKNIMSTNGNQWLLPYSSTPLGQALAISWLEAEALGEQSLLKLQAWQQAQLDRRETAPFLRNANISLNIGKDDPLINKTAPCLSSSSAAASSLSPSSSVGASASSSSSSSSSSFSSSSSSSSFSSSASASALSKVPSIADAEEGEDPPPLSQAVIHSWLNPQGKLLTDREYILVERRIKLEKQLEQQLAIVREHYHGHNSAKNIPGEGEDSVRPSIPCDYMEQAEVLRRDKYDMRGQEASMLQQIDALYRQVEVANRQVIKNNVELAEQERAEEQRKEKLVIRSIQGLQRRIRLKQAKTKLTRLKLAQEAKNANKVFVLNQVVTMQRMVRGWLTRLRLSRLPKQHFL